MVHQNHETVPLKHQKLAVLLENFKPIPFSPNKTLDFSSHEELFRSLNLWEFVNCDLSSDIRSDLLILFIANYDPSNHRSFVHNVEISVTRYDLANALQLEEHCGDTCLDIFLKDESKEAILEFLSKYIFVEDDDEMCILPGEAVGVAKMVKEGRANDVDWVGLMWAVIEKEIQDAPRSGSCRFALHVQSLMKCQHPSLFEKEVGMEEMVVFPEPEKSVEVLDSEDEDNDDDRGGFRIKNEGLIDGVVDCDGYDRENLFNEDKDLGFKHQLRRCNSNEVWGMGSENLSEGDKFSKLERLTSGDLCAMESVRVCYSPRNSSRYQGTGDFVSLRMDGNMNDSVFIENNGRRHIENVDSDVDDTGRFQKDDRQKRMRCEGDKFSKLERLTSGDLCAMESVRVSYSPRNSSRYQGTGDFVSLGMDGNMNDSVFIENNGRRHIENVDSDVDDTGRFHKDDRQKRMRCDVLWEEQAPGFDTYMEQIQCSMVKAKMLYAEKEQAFMDAHLQIQRLDEMLEQKDQIIRTLEKARVQERERWQNTVYQYEHELNVMANLLLGYKRALKKTKNEFEDYRKVCPQGVMPIYKDVDGAGGLVLTSRELEKLQLEKDEEMRRTAEEMVNAFQCDWAIKFEGYSELTMKMQRRLVDLSGKVKLIKESFCRI